MTLREEQSPEDDRQFDRLVDGELGEPERRELLSGLDHTPGGWRRCAMAFLEAQSWRQALGGIARQSPAPPEGLRGQPPRPLRRSWLGGLPATVLAMAACFLVALWLGWIAQDWRYTRRGGDGRSLTTVAENEGTRGPEAGPLRRPKDQPDLPSPDIGPWQTFTLALPDGPNGQGGLLQLPAREVDRLDAGWTQKLPSPLPPEVLRAFERTGHEVRDNHQVLRLKLPDGRWLLVPVDQVEVHYVGNPLY